MPVLPFHLPEPESEALRRLCQQSGKRREKLEQRAGGEHDEHERAHPEPPFSAADGLSYGEWVRRAR
jgi:hypothetical protein